jgi:hypothetical protein
VPLKNSTLEIEAPGLAVALAESTIVAGGAKLALLAGAVMVTTGGGGAVTVTVMGADVAVIVRLSVATAVRT